MKMSFEKHKEIADNAAAIVNADISVTGIDKKDAYAIAMFLKTYSPEKIKDMLALLEEARSNSECRCRAYGKDVHKMCQYCDFQEHFEKEFSK